ncbi:MAG: hypothetical protein KBC73_22000 [Burkholderiaceae bacterium]|nr:hypothetical protein [Burkholderiaceae bacterium]
MNTKDTTAQAASLPPPFTKEQLRKDIVHVYVMLARSATLLHPDHIAWPLAGPELVSRAGRLWEVDLEPDDLDISYANVRDSQLALGLEQQYDFGFHALDTGALEPMEYETMHMWLAALLMDLKGAHMIEEWESYGATIRPSVNRCLHTCELANARLTLEGKEPFSYFAGLDGAGAKTTRINGGEATSLDGLTIRQMALLSGMEEMTIRTAASRPGPNQLPTFKDEQRRTLVRPEDARKWLTAKGRYMPIKSQRRQLDLTKVRTETVAAFNALVAERIFELAPTNAARDRLLALARIEAAKGGYEMTDTLTGTMLLDDSFMQRLAVILELPPRLLAARARQAALRDEVAAIEQQIQAAAKAS